MRTDAGPGPDFAAGPRGEASWRVVAGQEVRDLWFGGRGLMVLFGFSVLMSVLTYLTASSQELNFLEQREAVGLAAQVAVAVGVLVTLVVSADALSGERERGTLENLLLTSVPRRSIAVGKLIAALTLWIGTFLVSAPYLWVLGRGISLWVQALLASLLVGTVLAAGLAAVGLLISSVSSSNKVSLTASLLLLLALFTPTQLPTMPHGWFGSALGHLNPVTAGIDYLDAVLVAGRSWTTGLSALLSPVALALVAGGILVGAAPRVIRLPGGVRRA